MNGFCKRYFESRTLSNGYSSPNFVSVLHTFSKERTYRSYKFGFDDLIMKPFDDVFVDCTKLGTKIKTEEYHETGKHIIIDQGQSEIAGYTDLDNGLFEDVPVIIFGDHTRVIKYVDKPFFIGADGVKVLRSKYENANYKYLYYALKNTKIPNTGYNRHYKWLKEVQIAYPNLNKQAEIVSILDTLQSIIAHRKQQLIKLDELVKARFVEMFGDPIDNPMGWKKMHLNRFTVLKNKTHS